MRSESAVRRTLNPAGMVAVSLGLLVFTWVLMLMMIGLLIEGPLAPWDMVTERMRPPAGTLERTLNDSFENGPAGLLLFAGVYGVQIAALVVGVHRRDWRLPAGMVVLNLLFILIAFAIGMIFPAINGFFPQPITFAMGYARTWPGILATVLLFITYWVGLWRLVQGKTV